MYVLRGLLGGQFNLLLELLGGYFYVLHGLLGGQFYVLLELLGDQSYSLYSMGCQVTSPIHCTPCVEESGTEAKLLMHCG